MILPSGFFIVVGQGALSCPGGKQAKSLSKGAYVPAQRGASPLFGGKAHLPGLLNP